MPTCPPLNAEGPVFVGSKRQPVVATIDRVPRTPFIEHSDECVFSARGGEAGGKLSDEQLKDACAKQVRAIGEMLDATKLPVIKVRHHDCIYDPASVAQAINQFLGGGLDEEAMTAAVDKSLYRQRG